MGVYFKAGTSPPQILFVGGAVAMASGCCCSSGCETCESAWDYTEWTISNFSSTTQYLLELRVGSVNLCRCYVSGLDIVNGTYTVNAGTTGDEICDKVYEWDLGTVSIGATNNPMGSSCSLGDTPLHAWVRASRTSLEILIRGASDSTSLGVFVPLAADITECDTAAVAGTFPASVLCDFGNFYGDWTGQVFLV